MRISDRVAIVTGSSKGIGLEACKQLLDEGVRVAGWSRSKTDIKHPEFLPLQVDVSDFHEVERAFNHTIDKFNKVDILINNAGLGYKEDFEKLSMEKWLKMFDVNVHGIYYCSKLAVPGMKARGGGHIINIGSIAGLNGVANMVGYAATKHAVTGISHSMFMELRNFGIKVTCIYPGSVKTAFFDNIDDMSAHDHMMKAEDIAGTIIHALKSSPNYHHVDIEVRPLKPKG